MDAKTFSLVAGVIFAVVALLHLVRIFEEWPVAIGHWSVPKSVVPPAVSPNDPPPAGFSFS